jgi:hypothetical protein
LTFNSPGRHFTFRPIPVRDPRVEAASRSLSGRSVRFRCSVRLAAILVLVAFSVLQASAASRGSKKNGTDESSADAPRFSIQPNDITLAVSQKQTFGVTDASGKQVAVRWKISGVGCAASSCGTIDANGAYQAPFSVSRPLVVMLEGIPVSNSEFPAFARIQLAPGSVPAPPPIADNKADEVATASPAAMTLPSISAASTPVRTTSAPNLQAAATQVVATQLVANQVAATQTSAIQNVPAQFPAANMPAAAGPMVAYQNGRLTINANNETLANVLRMVAQKTGATIIIPPGTGLERIVEHAGPAPASDVLGQLLKGSHFNFVLIGSPQHPNDLQQVLLTPRVDTGAPVVAAATLVAAPPMPMESAGTAPVDTVYAGPANGGPQPRSREEIRELLKERGREMHDAPQVAEPPAQPAQVEPGQAQPAQTPATDSQPADPPQPQ